MTRDLETENGLLRSLLRKLKVDGCAQVRRWPLTALPPDLIVPYDVDITKEPT